jgi:cell pole-organizing protein PopZ
MTKPAPKEPSMDEILSSIRQIIADDDAAIAPKRPDPLSAQAGAAPSPRPFPTIASPAPKPTIAPQRPPAFEAEPETPEPLALSPDQILADEDDDEPVTASSFEDIVADDDGTEEEPQAFGGEAELVDPEDIAFEADEESGGAELSAFSVPIEEPEPEPEVVQAAPVRPAPAPPPMAERPMPQPAPRPAPQVSQAAPMPDPALSSDIAEQLLEPTTKSAVKHAFSRLSGLSTVASGVTLEDMMRDMLRPMLKEWLDENLPSIVERMVEKEIARISRGVE